MKYGLGRKYSQDKRDRNYPMQEILPKDKPKRHYKYWWDRGWWGNQGSTPQCVAYSWLHFIEDGGVTQYPLAPGAGPISSPSHVYREAQKRDPWPLPHDGTTVRAGVKVFVRKELVTSYYWAWDVETLVDAVLYKGPVVVGTAWYSSMFYPDDGGVIKVEGSQVGGHAYTINGVNVQKRLFRAKNSWGRDWGKKGRFWITFDDMDYLLRQNGEACIAKEHQRPEGADPV